MNKSALIPALDDILGLERASRIQYLVFASLLTGPECISLQEHYREHAGEEGEHEVKVVDMIVYCGGTPNVDVADVETATGNTGKFKAVKKAEESIIPKYVNLHKLACDNCPELIKTILGILNDERNHLNDANSILGEI